MTHLRHIELEIANGKTNPKACKETQITAQTYYRWRKEFGGLEFEKANRKETLLATLRICANII